MENKTHFILGTRSYMLRHQGAICRRFIKMKDHQSNMYLGPCATCPLYVFDSGMETQVNMRHCVMGDL